LLDWLIGCFVWFVCLFICVLIDSHILATIEICKLDRGYLILLIVADGQVNDEKDTINAIIEASHYPMYASFLLPLRVSLIV
jgi:hypothetical protein